MNEHNLPLEEILTNFDKVIKNKKHIDNAPKYFDIFKTDDNKINYFKALKLVEGLKYEKQLRNMLLNYENAVGSFNGYIDINKPSEHICSQGLLIFILMRHAEKIIIQTYVKQFPEKISLNDDELSALESLSSGYNATMLSKHKI